MLIQSSLLILILLAIDAVLRKRVRAVFRYWIWMLVLIKLVLPPSPWSPVSVGTWVGDWLEVPAAALLELPPLPSLEEQGQDALATRLSPAVADFLSPPQPVTVARPLPEPGGPAAPGWDSITPEGGGATHSVAHPPVLSLNWQGLVLLVWAGVVVALLLLLTHARSSCGASSRRPTRQARPCSASWTGADGISACAGRSPCGFRPTRPVPPYAVLSTQ